MKADLIAILNAIATDATHPLAMDPDVGSAAAGASHAIYTRMTGDAATLPDLDALKDAKRYVVPQAPDTGRDDDAA